MRLASSNDKFGDRLLRKFYKLNLIILVSSFDIACNCDLVEQYRMLCIPPCWMRPAYKRAFYLTNRLDRLKMVGFSNTSYHGTRSNISSYHRKMIKVKNFKSNNTVLHTTWNGIRILQYAQINIRRYKAIYNCTLLVHIKDTRTETTQFPSS